MRNCCPRARLALRFCRGFALIRVRSLRSCRGAYPRFTFGGAFLSRLCPRASGFAFLSQRFALAHGWYRVPVAALILGSRLLFVLRQTGRLAIRSVPIPPGRDRHSRVLDASVRLSDLAGSLRVWMFLCGDPDGVIGDAGNEERGTGERGLAARCLCVFAQSHWHCHAFRGEYVGAARPKPAPKSRMWKPHCGLSGLSSRCGGVGLVRIRAAVIRVHGKTRPALIYGRAGRAV